MDLKQLQYFLAIAEAGQITAAAKKLHMAQPPLSQQLMLLEAELGVQLVERGARHLQLTGAGELLRSRAEQLLELRDATVKEVHDLSQGATGSLSIGTVSSSGAALLNERLADFHRKYAGVRFEIHEGNTFGLMDMLRKGLIEVGIVRTPFNARDFECRYDQPEPMIAVMTAAYDWDPGRSVIALAELRERPLIIYRRFEQLIGEACLECGFEPDYFCKNDDARTTLLWANAGLGIGIVPRSAFGLAGGHELRFKEIDAPKLHTRIAAIWVRDRYLSALAGKFIASFGGA